MKAKEIRKKKPVDLERMEGEIAEEVFRLQMQQRNAQLENTTRIGHLRRELARIKTVRHEREQGGVEGKA